MYLLTPGAEGGMVTIRSLTSYKPGRGVGGGGGGGGGLGNFIYLPFTQKSL